MYETAPAWLQVESLQPPKKLARQGKLKAGKKRKRSEGERAEYGVTRGVDFRGVKTVINVDAPATVQRYTLFRLITL